MSIESCNFASNRLLSIADMTEFYGCWNREIEAALEDAAAIIAGEFTPRKADNALNALRDCLRPVDERIPTEFTRSKVKLRKVGEKVSETLYRYSPDKFGAIRSALDELRQAIAEESHQSSFLVLSSLEQSYFSNVIQFGKIAPVKFKEIAGDIDEAYKCVALQRSTACVFHCMRILEFGVHRLATHFQIPLSVVNKLGKNQGKEWGSLCDQIVSHVKNLPDKTPEEQTLRLRFEDVAEHLQNVRMERNRVMHARYATTKRYTHSKAVNVLEETKDFIEKLALLLP